MSAQAVVPDQVGPAEEIHASAGRRVGSSGIVLIVVALFLVTAIIMAAGFGLTLVRLATGSMSPTFPKDSILLVRSIPAAHVSVGDVVTVSRNGTIPITHRVVEITPDVGSNGGAQLVLRGDANSVDDPEPYRVSRVGLVLGGIPFGGSLLVAIQSPIGLGLATMLVAFLALWAWWPRREVGAHVRESG